MFVYDGNYMLVKKAVSVANSGLLLDSVKDQIINHSGFDMSTADPVYLANNYATFLIGIDVKVVVYKPYWRWSKALGYFDPSKPSTIHLNAYKLKRSLASVVGTFYHEVAHMCDNADKYHSYGHGDNNPKGKQNTFPYAVGNMAMGFASGIAIDYNNTENNKYRKLPWFMRLLRLFT